MKRILFTLLLALFLAACMTANGPRDASLDPPLMHNRLIDVSGQGLGYTDCSDCKEICKAEGKKFLSCDPGVCRCSNK